MRRSNVPQIAIEMTSHQPDKNDHSVETLEEVSSEDASPGEHKDIATQMVKDAAAAGHHVIVTLEENKRILRKIDLAILPVILSIYGLQSLNKTSLSYASVLTYFQSIPTGLPNDRKVSQG